MRQAVRVGRQILLPRIRSTGQNRNSKCGSGIQHKRLGGWQPKTLYLPFQTLRHIGMAARRAIIRAGGSTHSLLQATPDMGRTRWILILCAWTIVGLLFAVRRIVLVKVQGTHVSWVSVGALELLYWYVWAAYTPLVIGINNAPFACSDEVPPGARRAPSGREGTKGTNGLAGSDGFAGIARCGDCSL
jgi:hypothetical protein